MRNGTYKESLPNVTNLEHNHPMQVKSRKVRGVGIKLTRNNVQRRLAVPKGSTVDHEVKRKDYQWTTQDSLLISIEKGDLEHSEDNTVLPRQKLNENRKDTFEKTAGEPVTEKTSGEVNSVETTRNGQESEKFSSEKILHSSGEVLTGTDTKKLARTIKNKVILPFRLQRQTRLAKRTDLQASNRSDRYIKESDIAPNEKVNEKIIMVPNEEHNAEVEEKLIPLSAGRLQRLIREKVFSQSQKSKKQANQKTFLLADYVRTLQKHMGIKDDVPESNSPDFSETPFIAAEKRFACEDEEEKEPREVDRRLEIMQRQLVRLPASFNLLDGDLVED